MSLKIDFHVHSVASKDGLQNLEEIALAAKNQNLDAVFVCDHNCYGLKEPTVLHGICLMPGIEISTKDAHVLAILCDSLIDEGSIRPDMSTSKAIELIHSKNGIAVIAHPYDHEWEPGSLTELPDGVETENARAWMRVSNANEKAKEYAKQNDLACFGGSDAHGPKEIGNAYTLAECSDISELKAAIINHKISAVLKQNTKRIYKAKSQLLKSKKENKPIKGYIYYLYSLLLDAVGR